MKKIFLLGAMVCALGMMTACGDKDKSDLIIGTWNNTAQSYETTIAGTESIPEGVIGMQFTANKVMISDTRRNCIAEWQRYTLTTENGKQILHVENSLIDRCVVEELTSNRMVLNSNPGPDMGFTYTMNRLD